MTARTIGGLVDWRALLPVTDEPRRETHAPTNRAEFMAAAVELARTGLTCQDIALVLHLTANGVRELLRDARAEQPC